MKTYTATSFKFTGHVEFTFNAAGALMGLQIHGEVSEEQRQWLWNHRPDAEADLQFYSAKSKLTITENLLDVTFDMFYEAYPRKDGKKKAETAWLKTDKVEQLKAYGYITTLKTKKQVSGEAIPYPATYLNQTRWND